MTANQPRMLNESEAYDAAGRIENAGTRRLVTIALNVASKWLASGFHRPADDIDGMYLQESFLRLFFQREHLIRILDGHDSRWDPDDDEERFAPSCPLTPEDQQESPGEIPRFLEREHEANWFVNTQPDFAIWQILLTARMSLSVGVWPLHEIRGFYDQASTPQRTPKVCLDALFFYRVVYHVCRHKRFVRAQLSGERSPMRRTVNPSDFVPVITLDHIIERASASASAPHEKTPPARSESGASAKLALGWRKFRNFLSATGRRRN